MRKGIKLWMGICVLTLLSACTQTSGRKEINVEADGQESITGINLYAPEDAVNVTYSYIEDGEDKISKTCFTLDEIKQVIINAFEVSFISDDDKKRYIEEVNKAWDKNF